MAVPDRRVVRLPLLCRRTGRRQSLLEAITAVTAGPALVAGGSIATLSDVLMDILERGEHHVIRTGWGSAVPRRLVLVAAAALIPVLAGCEAGNNAPTLDFHYPTDAAGTVVGDLSIRNVFVLGAGLGSTLQKGQSAGLFMAIINNGKPDDLISVSAPGTATSVALPSAGVPVVTGHPVFFTGPTPQVVLTGLTRTVASGSDIKVILTFAKAGPVTLEIPVMARATQYATFSPPPPTASPSPSTSATKGTHHGSTASPTPTATSTGSTSPSPSPST
jgi:copper(I)-binding protein